MKNFKKSILSFVFAAVMAVGVFGVSASAADTASWSLYLDTYSAQTSSTTSLTTYGGGYKAKATSITGNCALNYVTITGLDLSEGTVVALDKTVQFSTINNIVYFKSKYNFVGSYLGFNVKLTYANGTKAGNFGNMAINSSSISV